MPQIRSSLEHAVRYEAQWSMRSDTKLTGQRKAVLALVSSVAPQNMHIILSIRLIRVALEIPNWLGNFGTDKKYEQIKKIDPSLHSSSSVMNLK